MRALSIIVLAMLFNMNATETHGLSDRDLLQLRSGEIRLRCNSNDLGKFNFEFYGEKGMSLWSAKKTPHWSVNPLDSSAVSTAQVLELGRLLSEMEKCCLNPQASMCEGLFASKNHRSPRANSTIL